VYTREDPFFGMESPETKRVKRHDSDKKAKKRDSKRNSVSKKSKTLLPDLSLLEIVDPPPPFTSPTNTTTTSGGSEGSVVLTSSKGVLITLTRTEDVFITGKIQSPGRLGEEVNPIESSSSSSDQLPSSSSTSTSREKLIYKTHRDGFLNENRVPFDDVNFCFVCDTVDPDIMLPKNTSLSTIALGQRHSITTSEPLLTQLPKRPRSASAITSASSTAGMILVGKLGSLKRTIVKTSYKFTGEPVYRTVFLCPKCLILSNEAREKDKDYSLRISKKALTYF
jgi:hypothetical protein